MADEDDAQKDELDATLSARLRATRPSLVSPAADEPSDDELLRYIDGVMDERERAAFEARLAESPDAAARVAIVAGAVHDSGFESAAPPEPLARRAATAASRFVFQLSQGALTFLRGSQLPQALTPSVAVRSAAPSQAPRLFEFVSHHPFESGEIEARLALESSEPTAIDVQLEVLQHGAPLDGVRVKLLRDGRPIDSAPTERGRCTFTALTAARYELEIRKGGTEVGRMILDIRGDGTA